MPDPLPLAKQRALLKLEYEHEKAEFKRETEAMGTQRRVKRGDCWFPVATGRRYYNSLGRLVIELTRTSDTEIEHNFEYNRRVAFFSEDGAGLLTYLPRTGTVSYVDGDRMVVNVDEETATALQATERLGVGLHFDETTYALMFEALDLAISARGNRLAELRDIFHGTLPARFTTTAETLRLPWLNAAQEAAVRRAIGAHDVMIVHGPPGTGKTTTLVEAISEVLRREPQVMVCAQSNMAVDWISEQLSDRGISVLRIGNPTRVTDKMLAQTYERRFADHPDYPLLWQLRRTIRQMLSTARAKRKANFHERLAELRAKAAEIEIRIQQTLFDNARVIASTLTGAANAVLQGRHFHTLFIDEAAQALEAACWIALQKADRLIMAGDHKQLPPTIKSVEAMRGGLGRTLMEQIAEHKPESVALLTVQYRMNEELMRFSSVWFYGGRLTTAPEVRHRSLLDTLDAPLVWLDTSRLDTIADAGQEAYYQEAFAGNGYGRINKNEALLTISTLETYVARIGLHRLQEERTDFAVISPYRAQVQYLRRLLKQSAALRPLRKQISVNTIDAFQGQERDVVVISLVRANEKGEIGFLRDLRRMNVAMTRARMKLIIIGDSETLGHHKFYARLYQCCKPVGAHTIVDKGQTAHSLLQD